MTCDQWLVTMLSIKAALHIASFLYIWESVRYVRCVHYFTQTPKSQSSQHKSERYQYFIINVRIYLSFLTAKTFHNLFFQRCLKQKKKMRISHTPTHRFCVCVFIAAVFSWNFFEGTYICFRLVCCIYWLGNKNEGLEDVSP